jgi:hypothetical protein
MEWVLVILLHTNPVGDTPSEFGVAALRGFETSKECLAAAKAQMADMGPKMLLMHTGCVQMPLPPKGSDA